jgi:glycyl-tRNA synthetase beta chain
MPDLLIELFSEEIPARMQAKAADDLKKLVTNGLVEAGLTYAAAECFSTPRRLTLAVAEVLDASPATREERKGPRVDATDKAIEGFLRGAGVSRDALEVRDDKKGQTYFAVIAKPGRPAAEIIGDVLTSTIKDFPWPKSMRWGTGNLRWVRPLHSILCTLTDIDGTVVVPLEIAGITSGNKTQGHRFMAPDVFAVSGFEDYEAKLYAAKVVLNAEDRAATIKADADTLAFAQGLEVVEDQSLLAEVAGLVEWPVVLMGEIAPDFLGLPSEVLQTSMRDHQKFFSVRNPKTDRIEEFITVANRETADNGATILAGNQKVLFARLSDAKFFWENDIRIAEGGAGKWLDSLKNVTFHNKLGSQAERIDRIAALARELAPIVGADADVAEAAARFAKADLSSEMVGEFPELQGVMGRYYAGPAGHPVEVANAAHQHYSPLGPTDDVPIAPVSVAVALADKIDTLTGFWAIDEKPTGSKDPFALRRAALGVIRLVLGNGVRAKLGWLFAKAQQDVDGDNLLSFFHDRLKVHLRDQGVRHDVIDACLAMPGNDDLVLLVNRATALSDFLKSDDGENLLQGFRRANNILTAEEKKDGVSYELDPDPKFADHASETALFDALNIATPEITKAVEGEDFGAAMTQMASLRAPIDAFFEAVQINTDNQIIRRNRLCLLHQIRSTVGQVVDLTRIES